jgi:hypothetical protein
MLQVVELLRHAPQCSMLFNKFIPAYHHHYGHQCRVADYGFTKLIELFEAIPQVAKVLSHSDFEYLSTIYKWLNYFSSSSEIDTITGPCLDFSCILRESMLIKFILFSLSYQPENNYAAPDNL